MIFDVPTMVYVECAVSVLVTSVPFDMKTTIGAVLRSSCPCWSVNFCVSWGLFHRSSVTGADCWMCCLIWSAFLFVWYVWCLGCLRHIYPRWEMRVCNIFDCGEFWQTFVLFSCQTIRSKPSTICGECLIHMWQTIIIYLARTWSSSHQLTSFDLVQLDDAGDTIFSAKLRLQ